LVSSWFFITEFFIADWADYDYRFLGDDCEHCFWPEPAVLPRSPRKTTELKSLEAGVSGEVLKPLMNADKR